MIFKNLYLQKFICTWLLCMTIILPFLETLCLDVLAEGAFNLAKSLLGFILVAAVYKICEISKLSYG